MLDLALTYAPEGTDLSLTLATVHNRALLIATLRQAIQEAESAASLTPDPLAAAGFRTKAAYLQRFLSRIEPGSSAQEMLCASALGTRGDR
jgi:hypothetical protein